MNTAKRYFLLLPFIIFLIACSNNENNHNTFISIKTTLGDIKIRLYDETPLHRDNLIRLVNSHFYEGVSFHRVIKDFMVQTGDGLTRSHSLTPFNDTLNTYTVPAEFRRQLFHKKGAVAAAREGNDVNPEMKSSGTQFYIVQGVRLTDDELNKIEQKINNNTKQALFTRLISELSDSNRISGLKLSEAQLQEKASLRLFEIMANSPEYKITDEQRNIYKSLGGTPWLDGTYTVFGEVVKGLDVVDKIALVKTDQSDRPLSDIRIIKMKITKK
jgi:peptidylprolyl isomerase